MLIAGSFVGEKQNPMEPLEARARPCRTEGKHPVITAMLVGRQAT